MSMEVWIYQEAEKFSEVQGLGSLLSIQPQNRCYVIWLVLQSTVATICLRSLWHPNRYHSLTFLKFWLLIVSQGKAKSFQPVSFSMFDIFMETVNMMTRNEKPLMVASEKYSCNWNGVNALSILLKNFKFKIDTFKRAIRLISSLAPATARPAPSGLSGWPLHLTGNSRGNVRPTAPGIYFVQPSKP